MSLGQLNAGKGATPGPTAQPNAMAPTNVMTQPGIQQMLSMVYGQPGQTTAPVAPIAPGTPQNNLQTIMRDTSMIKHGISPAPVSPFTQTNPGAVATSQVKYNQGRSRF
jgi:hypothetical protein